jgi:PAS domain S-box-containing protein
MSDPRSNHEEPRDGLADDYARLSERLRESEQKFRSIFENAVEGIFQTTPEGRYLAANPALARMQGFDSPEELIASWTDIGRQLYVDPERRSEFVRRMQEDGVVRDFQFQAYRRDGGTFWISENVRAVRANDGNVLYYEGTAEDITERKRVEEALVFERYLLHSLMDNVPDNIYFKDTAGRFTRANQAVARRFGLASPSDLLGKTDFDFFSQEAASRFFADEQAVIRTGQPVVAKEEMELWPDGHVTWASTTTMPFRDPQGCIVGIFGVSRDISGFKRMEQALRASEARYHSLVENLWQCVFLKDRARRFVTVNKAFCQVLGRSPEEILGRSDDAFYPEALSQKYRADDEWILNTGQRLELDEESLIAGRRRTVRTVKTPVLDDQGQIIGVLGSFWDVTEQRALEAQLRQAQKMEAVGQLASGVAHDFNNLLTAILGNVALLSADVATSDPKYELLRAAEKAGSRAAELVQHLLGFSRQTLLNLEPLNLNAAVQEMVEILKRTIDPRIHIQLKGAEGLGLVQADPGQINQVLMNLCLNARDAMPEGGRLVLETDNVQLDDEYARLHLEARAGEFVRLRVSDTGKGIPADVLPRIFEPFFTTKKAGEGTGLGLAMVFGIIKQHQGWLDCYSEVGHGTRFDIYLPRARQELRALPTKTASVGAVSGSETILLVDDEALVRNLARTILQRHGYRVLLSEDGQQALEIYRRGLGRIDLVILDLTMPQLSGRETLQQLRLLDPNVRVVLCSGYTVEHVNQLASEGFCGFVNKPYRPEELARTVRTVLDKTKDTSQFSN